MKRLHIIILLMICSINSSSLCAEEDIYNLSNIVDYKLLEKAIQEDDSEHNSDTTSSIAALFDDRMMLNGYSFKYRNLSKDILLAMIDDDTLSSYKTASALKVLRLKHLKEIVSPEKKRVEKLLERCFDRFDSPFVQVEAMHTLTLLDRYRYFEAFVPALIQKLDHYNETVNEMAFNALNEIVDAGNKQPREARIIFNTLRKNLFLSRKHLAETKEPSPKLKQKLSLLRWAVKILGTESLNRLPKEVINLL